MTDTTLCLTPKIELRSPDGNKGGKGGKGNQRLMSIRRREAVIHAGEVTYGDFAQRNTARDATKRSIS